MAINYSLNVTQDGVECDSFKINSIYSLVVYGSKYYLQVYLGNYGYQIVDRQKRLDDHLVDSDETYFFDFDKWVS